MRVVLCDDDSSMLNLPEAFVSLDLCSTPQSPRSHPETFDTSDDEIRPLTYAYTLFTGQKEWYAWRYQQSSFPVFLPMMRSRSR